MLVREWLIFWADSWCPLGLCVVGNKNDDPVHKVVLTEDAQQFADQMGIDLFETSAKENINVEEVTYVSWLWTY